MKNSTPKGQLDSFLAKYTPDIATLARTVLAKMRKLLPGAVELVYDNYNWLVIGFGPTERPSEALFSIVLAPRWVTLCFLWGARLPDPHKLLRGGGKRVRNLRLTDPSDLDSPEVRALMQAAIDRSAVPFDAAAKRRLSIKSVSAKQRPRRPT
jgi:hypothetical protein